MVAGIVSVGDAGALGIVANGGEWGGKEQGEDSTGSGFNLGIRTAKAISGSVNQDLELSSTQASPE